MSDLPSSSSEKDTLDHEQETKETVNSTQQSDSGNSSALVENTSSNEERNPVFDKCDDNSVQSSGKVLINQSETPKESSQSVLGGITADPQQLTDTPSRIETNASEEKEKQSKVALSHSSAVKRRQSTVGVQNNQNANTDKQNLQARPIKDVETDCSAYYEEIGKFRKAQAAQRSTQWLLDELSRIQTSKTEPLVTQLLNDAKNYSRVIENVKRGNKSLKEEVSQLKDQIKSFNEFERPKIEAQHSTELTRLNSRISELEESFQEQQKNASLLTESYAKECEDVKQAQFMLQKRYEEEMSKMKEQIDDYRERLDNEAYKSTEMSSNLFETKRLLQEVTSERDSLRKELDSEQKNADVLMKHLRDAETQLASSRPWHAKFLSLEQYSKQTETILVDRTSTLKRNNEALRKSFKFMFIKFWTMFLKVRIAISSSRAKINALILATEGEVEKLRAIERPGVVPNSDAAPVSASLDISEHNASKAFVRFSTTFSSLKLLKDFNRNGLDVVKGKNMMHTIEEYGKSNSVTKDDVTWHEALELAINRKRNILRRDLVGLKQVTCWELFQKLGDEISMVYDPVLELVTRAKYLNEGCESLFAGNIVTMTHKLRLEEEKQQLVERVSQLEKQCEELALERDRERQTSATLSLRLAVLGRESTTQKKTSKQVQIVEEVLKQQGKLCSLKELLRITKRRIKQLREVKIQQHEQLEALARKEARESFTLNNIHQQLGLRPSSRMSISKSTSALMPSNDIEDSLSMIDGGHFEARSSFNRITNGVTKGSFSSRSVSAFGNGNGSAFQQLHTPGNSTQGPFQPIGVDTEDDETLETMLRQSLKETLTFAEGETNSDVQNDLNMDEAYLENEFGEFKPVTEVETSENEYNTPGANSHNYVRKTRLSRSEQEAARLKALERARERSLKEAETKAFWGGDSNLSIKDILHDRYVAQKIKSRENSEKMSNNNKSPLKPSNRPPFIERSHPPKSPPPVVNSQPPHLLKPINAPTNGSKIKKTSTNRKLDRLSRIYSNVSQGALNTSPSTASLGRRSGADIASTSSNEQ